MDEKVAQVIRAFLNDEKVKWDYSDESMISLALNNGLVGILPHLWKPRSRRGRKTLEKLINAFIARDAIQRDVMSEVFEKFNSEGIEYLLIKGWTISDVLYPPLTRFSDDIDILVRKTDYERAKAILYKCGFGDYQSRDGFRFTPLFKEEIMRHNEHPVEIDLHRELFSRGRFDYNLDDIFIRSVKFKFNGVPIKKMCPEDEMWYLVLHISSHFYRPKGINFLDIALHNVHYKVQMKRIVERFLRERNKEGAYFTFYILRKYDLMDIEEEILEKLRPSSPIRFITAWVIDNEKFVSHMSEFLYRSFIVWNTTSGIDRKLKFVLNYIIRRCDAYIKKVKRGRF